MCYSRPSIHIEPSKVKSWNTGHFPAYHKWIYPGSIIDVASIVLKIRYIWYYRYRLQTCIYFCYILSYNKLIHRNSETKVMEKPLWKTDAVMITGCHSNVENMARPICFRAYQNYTRLPPDFQEFTSEICHSTWSLKNLFYSVNSKWQVEITSQNKLPDL